MNEQDENWAQGRGPRPQLIANGLDWILAVVLGLCLFMALVSWAEEASPAFTAEVSK